MRRVAIPILVTLLLAALLQLAIAWAVWTRLHQSRAFLTPTQAELDAWKVLSSNDPANRPPFTYRRTGGVITSSQGWVVHKMGWPFLSFESRLDSHFRTTVAYRKAFDNQGWLFGWESGLVLFTKDPRTGATRILDLAIQPIASGFALNTLVYGIPIWFALFGVRTIRRRRRLRAGRCLQCGYDRDGAEICPECGTPSTPTQT